MPILMWSDRYSVGVSEFDQEHKHFIDLLNLISDATSSETATTQLPDLFMELCSYAEKHFEHEENLMVEHGYPDLESHKEEHVKIKQHLSGYREKITEDPVPAILDLLPFLIDWLEDHLVNTDKNYSEFSIAKAFGKINKMMSLLEAT